VGGAGGDLVTHHGLIKGCEGKEKCPVSKKKEDVREKVKDAVTDKKGESSMGVMNIMKEQRKDIEKRKKRYVKDGDVFMTKRMLKDLLECRIKRVEKSETYEEEKEEGTDTCNEKRGVTERSKRKRKRKRKRKKHRVSEGETKEGEGIDNETENDKEDESEGDSTVVRSKEREENIEENKPKRKKVNEGEHEWEEDDISEEKKKVMGCLKQKIKRMEKSGVGGMEKERTGESFETVVFDEEKDENKEREEDMERNKRKARNDRESGSDRVDEDITEDKEKGVGGESDTKGVDMNEEEEEKITKKVKRLRMRRKKDVASGGEEEGREVFAGAWRRMHTRMCNKEALNSVQLEKTESIKCVDADVRNRCKEKNITEMGMKRGRVKRVGERDGIRMMNGRDEDEGANVNGKELCERKKIDKERERCDMSVSEGDGCERKKRMCNRHKHIETHTDSITGVTYTLDETVWTKLNGSLCKAVIKEISGSEVKVSYGGFNGYHDEWKDSADLLKNDGGNVDSEGTNVNTGKQEMGEGGVHANESGKKRRKEEYGIIDIDCCSGSGKNGEVNDGEKSLHIVIIPSFVEILLQTDKEQICTERKVCILLYLHY
jgi:hypothetical protein